MKLRPEWSQRLLRKGVLVKETYELFAAWDDGLSDVQNLKSALIGKYRTAGWEREVSATLHRRLRHFDRIRPLIALAKGGMSIPRLARLPAALDRCDRTAVCTEN